MHANMLVRSLLFVSLLSGADAPLRVARAAEANLHVDPTDGNDAHDGRSAPVRTIGRAIKLARPGDTIHLRPMVYHDYAGFYGKQGLPGRPITLDGHGSTLEGSDPLDPAKWKEVSPGLFAHDELLPPRNLDDAVLVRWFFLWDGKMNHMGRTSKGTKAPLKELDDLKPGEWTFVRDPAREQPGAANRRGTFYVRLPPGQKLADAKIAAPMRSAGVQMSGDNAHLVIKNLTCTHAYNDGFNIHGDCRDVAFENIRAVECGDDGISAHESAEYHVDGFISLGNSTGITDTGTATTSYKRVFIAECRAYDLYFLNNGRYKVDDAVVLSSSEHPLVVSVRAGEHCELRLQNVFVRRLGTPEPARIEKHCTFYANRLTLEHLEVVTRGDTTLDNCLINGRPHPENSPATGADLEQLLEQVVPSEYRSKLRPR